MRHLLQVAWRADAETRGALLWTRSMPEARASKWGRRRRPNGVRAVGERSKSPAQLAFKRPDAVAQRRLGHPALPGARVK